MLINFLVLLDALVLTISFTNFVSNITTSCLTCYYLSRERRLRLIIIYVAFHRVYHLFLEECLLRRRLLLFRLPVIFSRLCLNPIGKDGLEVRIVLAHLIN